MNLWQAQLVEKCTKRNTDYERVSWDYRYVLAKCFQDYDMILRLSALKKRNICIVSLFIGLHHSRPKSLIFTPLADY